jgi:hypothetical protein
VAEVGQQVTAGAGALGQSLLAGELAGAARADLAGGAGVVAGAAVGEVALQVAARS